MLLFGICCSVFISRHDTEISQDCWISEKRRCGDCQRCILHLTERERGKAMGELQWLCSCSLQKDGVWVYCLGTHTGVLLPAASNLFARGEAGRGSAGEGMLEMQHSWTHGKWELEEVGPPSPFQVSLDKVLLEFGKAKSKLQNHSFGKIGSFELWKESGQRGLHFWRWSVLTVVKTYNGDQIW